MATKKPKKKKTKSKEPDLFTYAKNQKGKVKKWKFPKGVRYAEVKVGDIFVFTKSRNWEMKGKIEELEGELIEKGVYDSNSRYYMVKMLHPELVGYGKEDIRRFNIKKKK
ncbi:hypothetical protein J7L05_02375 [bacterium]|nr:hypothetical protein [bacterium]